MNGTTYNVRIFKTECGRTPKALLCRTECTGRPTESHGRRHFRRPLKPTHSAVFL